MKKLTPWDGQVEDGCDKSLLQVSIGVPKILGKSDEQEQHRRGVNGWIVLCYDYGCPFAHFSQNVTRQDVVILAECSEMFLTYCDSYWFPLCRVMRKGK